MLADTETQNIIKGIINVRCREGATLSDLKDDYEQLIGKPWPLLDKPQDVIHTYLKSIDGVYCVESHGGFLNWFVKSKDMHHLASLIKAQKFNRPVANKHQQMYFSPKPINEQTKSFSPVYPLNSSPVTRPIYYKANKPDDCFFKDNYIYKWKRYQMQNLNRNTYNDVNPSVLDDAYLMGDDFFLSLATKNLGKQLTKKNGIYQCGLCVSGLSIQAATALIEKTKYAITSSVIINVGSVDILHGRELIDMRVDFKHLIDVCERRNIRLILTTLAPLANSSHTLEIRDKLLSFNSYLLDTFFQRYLIIDVWSQMVTPRGNTRYNWYNAESIYVSGSNQPHVLWNQNGRQRILNYINESIQAKAMQEKQKSFYENQFWNYSRNL